MLRSRAALVSDVFPCRGETPLMEGVIAECKKLASSWQLAIWGIIEGDPNSRRELPMRRLQRLGCSGSCRCLFLHHRPAM